MFRILARFLLAAVFLLCCAWGATGHKVVAQIAYDHLTPKAKAEVDKLHGGSMPADMPPDAWEFKMSRD